ncbi:MARVEL-like domain [Pyrenophora seminiperda CCB06]|uniref:MARVEL-like domain n=1 Tax=Pyrenophora seminiperda CCB06 TaxID=1302712 RepID=A0A3M7LY11_9PLEO|nr:MARVEL-like domain [Pyrenophora seminiperda CCB06]
MAKTMNWVHGVRAVQAVLSVAVLGLMAYVSSWWATHWRQSSPMEINYLIFAPAWSILALIPILMTSTAKYSHLLDQPTVNGFVALGVFLSGRICFGMVCDVARASTVISATNWLAWCVTLVFGVMVALRKKDAPMLKQVDMHQGV